MTQPGNAGGQPDREVLGPELLDNLLSSLTVISAQAQLLERRLKQDRPPSPADTRRAARIIVETVHDLAITLAALKPAVPRDSTNA
jgi:hypothetical protein